jgi:16S rRNA (cytosine1402-N4)-methyltransferase
MSATHTPVLVNEVIELLKPSGNGLYVDGTIGLGGHAEAILQACAPDGHLLGIDLDAQALTIAAERLHEYNGRFTLVEGNFADLDSVLEKVFTQFGIYDNVNGVLFDLGVSSYQLDTASRGFSFSRTGPLDMRMNPKNGVSAAQVVNQSPPDQLTSIFSKFGEERRSKKIADRIVQARQIQPITTTSQLAEIIRGAVPQNTTRASIHPATRIFQALRIYVNDELKNLHLGLDTAISVLKPGSCICVISFHSLEDRIVKNRFRTLSRSCICPPRTPICICQHRPSLKILTKRPTTPQPDEIQKNPRSRSAKLRAAVKICESKIQN